MADKKPGRPSEYDKAGGDDKVPAIAKKMCLLGAIEEDLAAAFGVSRRTITNWEKQHELFRAAIQDGRVYADMEVAQSLFDRATGAEWTEQQAIKVKKVEYENGKKLREIEEVEIVEVQRSAAPDTVAGIFWLKNRRAQNWRDRQETKISADGDLAKVLAAIDGQTKSV
ncbi:hypothetical protein KMP13_02285 [Epibacterium ulvae]|uniref:hypothetical protein n=1 Tax=Epibacterium ulvae TaxID=1156985 RepID=UPI001BFC9B6F|nr:hypothetical protein [Epibacterium ulvae]MBT8152742.1 hypothetical protein [Epibacterium ulvae]